MGTRQTDNRLSYWLETPKAARSPCQSVSSGTSLRLGQEGGEEGGMMKDITKRKEKCFVHVYGAFFFLSMVLSVFYFVSVTT